MMSFFKAFENHTPIFGRVERRLRQHDVVLLGLTAEVLEQALLPHALHVIPVLTNHITQNEKRKHSGTHTHVL